MSAACCFMYYDALPVLRPCGAAALTTWCQRLYSANWILCDPCVLGIPPFVVLQIWLTKAAARQRQRRQPAYCSAVRRFGMGCPGAIHLVGACAQHSWSRKGFVCMCNLLCILSPTEILTGCITVFLNNILARSVSGHDGPSLDRSYS